MTQRVTSAYEHKLQSAYWSISNRGICVEPSRLIEAGAIIDAEIQRNLQICTNQWGCVVFVGKDSNPDLQDDPEDEDDSEDQDESEPAPAIPSSNAAPVNINATRGKYAFLQKLKDLGYNVPKITKKDQDGNYDQHFSTGELAIQKMLSENQFKYPGGDPALRSVLKIRELGKLKTSYLNARLFHSGEAYFFLSNYNVAGTLTGRRSSRRHTFSFGNNGQNFPKHSSVAGLFRRALVARVGNILVFVDQIQAEDWPVSALSGNQSALGDLRAGIDRHSQLATMIWGHRVPPKTALDWSDALYEQERYIGKKARHANNYGMKPPRFRDVLVQEASLTVTEATCRDILNKVNQADPSVQGVFHKYVQDTLSSSRVLITPEPFCRERQALCLRPTDGNSNLIKEYYAFIPQSTVGDNTGYAVLEIEGTHPGNIVQEGHDSIVQDVPDSDESVFQTCLWTAAAFKRTIRFYNGIEIEIPIEYEIGYDFKDTVKVKVPTLECIHEARQKLQDKVRKNNAVQVAVLA